MLRIFSEEKKQELFDMLDEIEMKEWKSFRNWGRQRNADYGEWAEKLDIYRYMNAADSYQQQIHDLNESTKTRIDTVFENVYEVDSRYGELLQGHMEKLDSLIMMVLELGDRIRMYPGTPAGAVGLGREQGLGGIHDWIEKLIESLKALGQSDQELKYASDILENFLEANGYTNSVERKFIIAMLMEKKPELLLGVYRTYGYSSADCTAVVNAIITYYESCKIDVTLQEIETNFRNEENLTKDQACEYLEYLLTLQYICQAEYDRLTGELEQESDITPEKKEELCGFMLSRNELFQSLREDKTMDNGEVDGGWTRKQIVCALQIEAVFDEEGLDEAFIMGLIGNMKGEGSFGEFEWTNKNGSDSMEPYWEHINDCIDYHDKYSYKNIENIDLVELYADLIWKRYEGGCEDMQYHYFGIGAMQWTDSRTEKLLPLYLEQAGYDAESDEFQELVGRYLDGEAYEEIYLTKDQIRNAEIEMMVYEITCQDLTNIYRNVYPHYLKDKGEDVLENILQAEKTVEEEYIKPGTDTHAEREAAALRWYEATRGTGND